MMLKTLRSSLKKRALQSKLNSGLDIINKVAARRALLALLLGCGLMRFCDSWVTYGSSAAIRRGRAQKV